MLKKNDIIRLNINDLTNLGFGVGRVEGQVVFVSDAVTGDRCEVRLIKINKNYLVGRVERYIYLSPLRTSERCRERACRSCAYKNIAYGGQNTQLPSRFVQEINELHGGNFT